MEKTYKEHDLFMAKSNEESKMLLNIYVNEKHGISPFVNRKEFLDLVGNNTDSELRDRGYAFQHLYVTSDEEMKIGDWVYQPVASSAGEQVFQVNKDNMWWLERHPCKKIIITTDPKLSCAMLSNEFIEEYVKNPVNTVKVEYSYFISASTCKKEKPYYPDCLALNSHYGPCGCGEYKLKLTDNEANVKVDKPKLYTEEEVEALTNSAYIQGAVDFEKSILGGWKKWFDKHLKKNTNGKNI